MKLILLCLLMACTATPVEPTARMRVCFAPDTVWVTICGDTTAMVFQECF